MFNCFILQLLKKDSECEIEMTFGTEGKEGNYYGNKQNLLTVCLVSLGSTAAFSNQNI